MSRPGSVLAVLLALVAVPGCDHLPFGYTAVKEIVARPANFEGHEVKLKGTAARGLAG